MASGICTHLFAFRKIYDEPAKLCICICHCRAALKRADSLLDIFSGVLPMKAGEYLINLEGHYVAIQTALAQLLSTYLGRKKMAGKEEGR